MRDAGIEPKIVPGCGIEKAFDGFPLGDEKRSVRTLTTVKEETRLKLPFLSAILRYRVLKNTRFYSLNGCFIANVDYMSLLKSVSFRLFIDTEDRHVILFLINF